MKKRLIQEGVFQDAMGWIKKKGTAAKDATVDFLKKVKIELEQTAEGAQILAKLAQGEDLDPKEKDALKTQITDIGKGLPLMALFALPGGGIATVALVKLANKFGVELMPTAFQDQEKVEK
tara:strand:- start:615 stop:977 length:363 start_codon:yes stop_codon:yes gene_type:complete